MEQVGDLILHYGICCVELGRAAKQEAWKKKERVSINPKADKQTDWR